MELIWSTATFKPSNSKIWSASLVWFSNAMWYWKPEQPPPTTATRRAVGTGLCMFMSSKVKEIMNMQSPVPTALRVAVVGGGCSGFQYHMAFENQTSDADQIFEFDGLKVAVDQMSSMYLDGIEIDYIETLEGAGFKFNNPNVKSTCGCGSSFSV